MDNMNGLWRRPRGDRVVYFATIAASRGQYLVALIAFLTVGALLGFLPYNFPSCPGVLRRCREATWWATFLAVVGNLPHFYTSHHPRPWRVLIPVLVLAVAAAGLNVGCDPPLRKDNRST